MFFIIFALSIRIFTLFLSFYDSEILLIPAIIIFASIRTLVKLKKDKSIQRYKTFIKNLIRWFIWNIFAAWVISTHLYLRNPIYTQHFLWIQKIEFTASNRENFNDFVRISDTQKYHKYYVEAPDWKKYSLSSEKDYHIWDQFFLSASKKDLDLSNIFSFSRNEVLSPEFWNYEFNYDKWLFMKWVDGSMYEKESLIFDCNWNHEGQTCSDFTIQWKSPDFDDLWKIDKIRDRIQNTVISIFGENKYSWLLLWLLIWDKSMIPSDNYDTFVNSWLVHIIAVSGWNMAMVVVLLSFIFARLPFYIKNALLIVWICLYAMLCWSDASVIRAAIMWSLTLIALFRWREISIRRAMLYAFFTILVINPFSLWYDVWFMLSFAAIVWIVLFQSFSQNRWKSNKTTIKSKNKKSDFFQCKFRKEYLVPTIWASLWTAPILIFFMNWVNLIWILLNIFIVPIIPIVTIYGFTSVILSAITSRTFRIRPEKLLMNIIYGLSTFWAKYAIFLQSEVLWKKYILIILFIFLWIFAYLKIYYNNWKHNKTPKIEKNPDSNEILDNILEDL